LHAFNILFGIILARMFLGWLSGVTGRAKEIFVILVMTIALLAINPWLANILDYGSFVILLPLM